MKFDSNRAWQEASAAISANRDVVLPLAGVFFLLPGLVLALFFPAPEATVGMDQEAQLTMISDYYVSLLPVAIPIILLQLAGTLALLTLLTDAKRPTVGEAIRLGAHGILPYFAAQLIVALAVGLGGGLIVGILGATGIVVLATIALIVLMIVFIYAMVKTSLAGPVIAVERERNPIEALKRSWALTKGNSVRIAVFYLLFVVAAVVSILVVTSLTAVALALFAGERAVFVTVAVVSSALNAMMALYFVGIIAATHRQLAGPSASQMANTFD